jgi:predicted PurR-regulated permease PerM
VHIIQRADLIIANITGGIYNVVRGVIDVVIGLVVSFYLLYHKETFGAQGKKIIYSLFRPDRANTVLQGVRFVDRTCGGFISGKILDSLIVGVICYISMLILKMPYPALIAVVVGVTNVIPFFGPFIGAVPCALILIFISPLKCLIFIVYIIVLQQIDGNIIGPRILGNTTGLSGFWILFALLFFGSLFGFWGMMLGVPVFSVIYAVVKRLISKKLRKRELPVDTQVYEKLERVDEQTNQAVSRTAEQESAVPRFVRRRRSRKKAPEEKQDDET